MGGSLWMDPDGAEAVSRELSAIASELAAELDRANAGLAAAGAPWGNDATGKVFARSYVPDNEKVTAAGKDAVAGLHSSSAGVTALVQSMEAADRQGAQQVSTSGVPSTGNAPTETIPADNAAAQPQLEPSTTAPGAADEPVDGTAAAPESVPPQAGVTPVTANPASDAAQPGGPTTQTPTTQPPNTTQPNAGRPDTNQPDVPNSPRQTPHSAQPSSNGSGARPTSGDAGVSRPEWVAAGRKPSTTSRPAAGKPADDTDVGSGTASDSAAARSEAAQPTGVSPPAGNGSVPEPSTPGVKPVAEEDESNTAGEKRLPRSGDRVSKRETAIGTCARHGVAVTGFDDLDVPDDVLAEIAAAVDAVCGRYPWIGVRRVGIAELDPGEWARTGWDCYPGERGPVPYTDHILFSAAAARAPDEFADIIGDATQSGHLVVGSQWRPVYSTMIRELGHAMNVAGGFAADAQAHRRLIAAYLGGDDRHTVESLARVVSGFHDWRASLPRCCVRGGRFHPPAALAEAFTEVMLHGEAAGEPAKALHRLLVDTALQAREPQ